jgi:hypothetical protein
VVEVQVGQEDASDRPILREPLGGRDAHLV